MVPIQNNLQALGGGEEEKWSEGEEGWDVTTDVLWLSELDAVTSKVCSRNWSGSILVFGDSTEYIYGIVYFRLSLISFSGG